ncbi:hypothetical protein JW835_05480 [bacterium]|nr:hypothetical protein [bacterium]
MGSAYINNFHARRDNDNRIILEWITESEINVARFIIKRNDQKIGSVPSKSSNSTTQQFYQFIDSNTELLKSSASSLNYSLTIVDVNGHSEDYPVIASISGNSGIRHTWGSLKALFR